MKKLHSTLLLLLAFILCGDALYAQKMTVKNLEKYDTQWIHFGFLLGINNADFKVTRSDTLYKSDSALVVTPDGQTGFNLGIVTNLHLGNNFDLRFTPTLSFCQRNLNYQIIDGKKKQSEVIKIVESTFIQFPLDLKFKSNRINNYRMYVTGGVAYLYDLVSQAKVTNDEQIVKLKKSDYGYSIGFGFDFYMPLFKFSPEIKMFQGIPNTLAADRAVYTTSLSSLKTRLFSFTLTFE